LGGGGFGLLGVWGRNRGRWPRGGKKSLKYELGTQEKVVRVVIYKHCRDRVAERGGRADYGGNTRPRAAEIKPIWQLAKQTTKYSRGGRRKLLKKGKDYEGEER